MSMKTPVNGLLREELGGLWTLLSATKRYFMLSDSLKEGKDKHEAAIEESLREIHYFKSLISTCGREARTPEAREEAASNELKWHDKLSVSERRLERQRQQLAEYVAASVGNQRTLKDMMTSNALLESRLKTMKHARDTRDAATMPGNSERTVDVNAPPPRDDRDTDNKRKRPPAKEEPSSFFPLVLADTKKVIAKAQAALDLIIEEIDMLERTDDDSVATERAIRDLLRRKKAAEKKLTRAKVSLPKKRQRIECALCDAEATLECTGCNDEYYCSKTCQFKRWREHNLDCRWLTPEQLAALERAVTDAQTELNVNKEALDAHKDKMRASAIIDKTNTKREDLTDKRADEHTMRAQEATRAAAGMLTEKATALETAADETGLFDNEVSTIRNRGQDTLARVNTIVVTIRKLLARVPDVIVAPELRKKINRLEVVVDDAVNFLEARNIAAEDEYVRLVADRRRREASKKRRVRVLAKLDRDKEPLETLTQIGRNANRKLAAATDKLPKKLQRTECALCGAEAKLQCAGCGDEVYCSVDCQMADWVEHKLACC